MAAWPVRDRHHEWKLEMDVDYVDWTSFRNLDVRLAGGTTLPNPQKWSDDLRAHVRDGIQVAHAVGA